LGPQGGPEGPRVEIDTILAPIWGPFWDHVGASGPAFGDPGNDAFLKTLFERIWTPLWAARCAPSIVNSSKIEGSRFAAEGAILGQIWSHLGGPFGTHKLQKRLQELCKEM